MNAFRGAGGGEKIPSPHRRRATTMIATPPLGLFATKEGQDFDRKLSLAMQQSGCAAKSVALFENHKF
jgi:hypothetical protein